jgi:hypothetical protein
MISRLIEYRFLIWLAAALCAVATVAMTTNGVVAGLQAAYAVVCVLVALGNMD